MRFRARELPGLGLLACVAHAPVLTAGFAWLDHGDLERGYALAPAGQLFLHGFARTGFYRPLTALTLSLDAATHLGPAMFHASNLLFHAVAAVLVAVAAVELGLEKRAALLAGALFAVHPVTSEVVGAISYRAEALITASMLGALIAHRRGRWLLTAVLLAAAGLFKETGLVLGPLLLIAAGPRNKMLARAMLGSLFALALRLAFAPPWHAPPLPLSLGQHIATRAGALWRSLGALVGPPALRLCDDVPILGLGDPRAILGILAALALALLAWRKPAPVRLFALALLPSISPIPVPRLWSPHYLYVPLAFAAMAVAAPLVRMRLTTGLALAGVVAMSVLSYREAARYHDDRALFEAELMQQPMCREGWLYVGDARREANDLAGAREAYQRALAPTPGHVAYVDRGAALQNLGITSLQLGEPADAERALRDALDHVADPRARRELVHDLAAARLAEGHPEDAAALLESETRRPDALPASLLLRAQALDALGRHDEAAALRARMSR